LKEFEQLARQALGSDEGIAPIEPEDLRQDASTGIVGDVPAADDAAATAAASGDGDAPESEADSKTRAAENRS